ncbi:MAG: hypothetical protein LBT51_09240, partial [Fusobacteriaceae bacterium]|nr:hypothetical protein [Fusobacteriaceae bacterium]
MQKEFTFKEIYNVIENLEITECLFSKKIVNVYFWKIIKYELINGIFLKAKITQKAHDIKVTKFDALKTIFLA